MSNALLICTDLDRTLIPNGPQNESTGARQRFQKLVARSEVTLVYVSGRSRALVEQAIEDYHLPYPDFVIGDVGTTLFRINNKQDWQPVIDWQSEIAQDWNGLSGDEIARLLTGPELTLQEAAKQNDYKLSYYVPLDINEENLTSKILQQLEPSRIKVNLIWSEDEANATGLLDILPARASKYHAICALMKQRDFTLQNTVFCGDSGNDLEVLCSPIASVLVANAQHEVSHKALQLARQCGNEDRLYIARGGFLDMNGNYSAGMLEGIAHYHPYILNWMD